MDKSLILVGITLGIVDLMLMVLNKLIKYSFSVEVE